MKRSEDRAQALWRAALACFVIAGASGALLRFGFLYGLPRGIDASHLRHAHSHLMYFSWATPAIAALMIAALDRARRALRAAGWAALILGAAAYPFFLVAGYGPVPVGGRSLPLASITSGLNTFAWYALGTAHFAAHRGRRRTPALGLLDAAVLGLWLSTVGAWGRAVMQFSGAGDGRLGDLFVQLFPGAFSHGWLILAPLGLALAAFEPAGGREDTREDMGDAAAAGRGRRAAFWLLLAGLPGASLAGAVGADAGAFSPPVTALLGASALSFVAGAAWHGRLLAARVAAEKRWEWAPFLACLALTLVMLAAAAFPAAAAWGIRAGLRVFYLHVLALGVASAGLVTAACQRWGREAAPSPRAFSAAVLALLAGVASLSPLWADPAGAWPRAFAAYTSLAPLLPVLSHLVRNLLRPREVPVARG